MRIKDDIAEVVRIFLDSVPEDTIEQYRNNLEDYKSIIDKTPDHFLKFHFDDQLKKEHYELVDYIKNVADKRGVDL